MKSKILLKTKQIFLIAFLVFFLFSLTGGALFIYYAKGLPRPEVFEEKQPFHLTRIYDRTGNILLYELFGKRRKYPIILEDAPQHLIQAIIVTEDTNFYYHPGVDFRAIIRASWANLRAGRVVQGASTITQQLSRLAFLTGERTIERKIRELVLTIDIERRHTKDEILEFYLNLIPFGSNIYGVGAASYFFFNKSVSEISVPEAAILAALIRAPSHLSPFGPNLEQLLNRKNHVLNRMIKKGYLNREKAEELKQKEVEFAQIYHPIRAPHFVMEVKNQLFLEYGREYLKTAGLKVYTSLDWDLQKLAEEIIKERTEHLKAHNAHNVGLVAIEPKTGQILAMVGSKNWFAEPYPQGCQPGINCLFEPYPNIAFSSRQSGSAFKPLVFAAAFENNPEINDETIVIDERTDFGIWGGEPFIPYNFDRRFRGPITLRQALAQSLNIPAVKVLLDLVGIESSVEMAKNLGITTLQSPHGPSFALGVSDVSLIEMVSAYGVFASQGLRVPPISILKIEDPRRNIAKTSKHTPRRVLSIESAQLINNILADDEARAPMFGRRRWPLYFKGFQVSAKTGTTDDFRDAWIIGYTSSIVVGVWVGNNDNSPMVNRALGVVLAAPIWRQFIENTLL